MTGSGSANRGCAAQAVGAGRLTAAPQGVLPVFCVVVSYNSGACLPGCLGALLAQEPPPSRIMVVDNASSDDSATAVEREFPQVEVVRNRRNVGYGAAANQGIEAAMEEGIPYVLVLNPDVVLEPGAAAAMVRALEETPTAAVAGPRILEAGRNTAPGSPEGVRGPAAGAPRLVPWLSGCALLLRTAALRQVGGFWPGFFLYGEETDLHYRLRTAGWQLVQVPAAGAHHLGAASSREFVGGARVCYYQIRNAFVLAKRTQWRHGVRATVGTVRWQLQWIVTLRRLLHPTRLAAILLGLVVGTYLFVRVKALEVPTVLEESGHGARGIGPRLIP